MPSANRAIEFNMMMRFLTLLLCIGCNVRSCWLLRWNKTTRAGEEVELNCTLSVMSKIFEYVLWKKETTQLFVCFENNCSKGYEDYELVTSNFSSILKIPNVSLDDEGRYTCEIYAEYEINTCYITLTTNVPPEKLILLDNDTNEILNKSLKVINGTDRTIRCQTSTSVKPTVNLEWIIPEGLQVIIETGDEVDDEHNERLVVPMKTLSFIPTDKDHGKNITCIFNTDNDAESLKTSVYFTTEDISSPTSTTYKEVAQQDNATTPREPPDSSPSGEGNEDGILSPTSTTSKNRAQQNNTTTPTDPLHSSPSAKDREEADSHIWYIIGGVLSVLVIVVITLIIRGIRVHHNKAANESTDTANSTRRDLPPVPFLPLSSIDDVTPISSKPVSTRTSRCMENVMQSTREVAGDCADIPEIPGQTLHVGRPSLTGYMDMNPITSPITSSNGEKGVQKCTCISPDNQACYMDPTLMCQTKDDSVDRCEPMYENTRRESGKITSDPHYINTSWCDDIVDTTYI